MNLSQAQVWRFLLVSAENPILGILVLLEALGEEEHPIFEERDTARLIIPHQSPLPTPVVPREGDSLPFPDRDPSFLSTHRERESGGSKECCSEECETLQ